MTETEQKNGRAGARFLGEITASLSHELKNVLAIINENAGLLEDFVFMTAGGKPINPERLGTVAGKIRHQVRRADGIIKRLNQVGHSVDRPLDSVRLADLVEAVCALADRKAALKNVALTITPPLEPVTLTTDPFTLQRLLWVCIDMAIGAIGESSSIEISVKSTPNSAMIVLGPLEAIQNNKADIRSEWPPKNMLKRLKADLVTNRDQGTLAIQLPLEIAA